MPPAGGYARRDGVPHARFDVVVLIEASTPDGLEAVQNMPAYQQLHDALGESARDLHVMAARCTRSVGDVDKTRPGCSCSTTSSPTTRTSPWNCGTGWPAGTRYRPGWTTPPSRSA